MPGPFAIQDSSGSRTLDFLDHAPASDTGQVAIPVRVISQPAAAGGGTGAPSDALTDAQLRAAPVDVAIVSGSQVGGLTDAELRATPVPVSIAGGGSSTGLTDVELRASPVPVSGFPTTQPVSGTVAVSNLPATQPVTGSVGVTNWPGTQPVSGTVAVSNFPATQPVNGTVNRSPATAAVSQTGLAAASVTATLPTPGAGLFHYLTRINIIAYATAARTGSATATVASSTNLYGLAWNVPSAMAIGTQYETDIQLTSPLRSQAANTATTIVGPATTSVIWRINVIWYTGP